MHPPAQTGVRPGHVKTRSPCAQNSPRRRLINMPPHMQVEQLLAALQRFPTNAALVGSAG